MINVLAEIIFPPYLCGANINQLARQMPIQVPGAGAREYETDR